MKEEIRGRFSEWLKLHNETLILYDLENTVAPENPKFIYVSQTLFSFSLIFSVLLTIPLVILDNS